MSYILKNTSALINTRLTDTGREKLSQGNFKISYFQIGDSEVSYNVLPNSYNQTDTMILEPAFNAQNSSGAPQSNKQNIKYPFYVDGFTGNTYGIPYMDSVILPVYNRAEPRGFFTGITTNDFTYWSAYTDSQHAINSNYMVDMSTFDGSDVISVIFSGCNTDTVRIPQKGDFITIYYDGRAKSDCGCATPTTTTTTTTLPPTTTTTTTLPCEPITTTTTTFPPEPEPVVENCAMSMYSCYAILTYRILDVCHNEITLDRPTPDYTNLTTPCYARTIIYPPNMTDLYDSVTPLNHFNDNVINYDSLCNTDELDVKIWNMNIPWSEDLAGLDNLVYKGFPEFGSVQYMGTKEYLGYQSSSGQTDTDSVYYYNSFGEKIVVSPEEQKAIAVIHYTNQTIDFFYGEKFALEPLDPTLPEDTIGQARNFKICMPTLMWHKNPDCCQGQCFWVDPPGFEEFDLFQVEYIKSKKNLDMNQPGIRYYHLWDNNPTSSGLPSRIGKVFPDHKIVIIDDEEIIAAMSYKSNRNWTLPAPKVALSTPNTCGPLNQSSEGVLTGSGEYMYVTYRFTNQTTFTNSLHCNYYSKIQGPKLDCTDIGSQNVSVRFGGEFGCLNYTQYTPATTTTTTTPIVCYCYEVIDEEGGAVIDWVSCDGTQQSYTTAGPEILNFCAQENTVQTSTPINVIQGATCLTDEECGFVITNNNELYETFQTTPCPDLCDIATGYFAESFEIICQKVTGDGRPEPTEWRIIDYTDLLSATTINGYLTSSGITGSTFVITKDLYDAAPIYDLSDYINIIPISDTGTQLNFGDEYYFYGTLESDIQATIYEMKYKINLGDAEFQASSNPGWSQGNPLYLTEIGLYDDNKDLMIISKLQSPILRQGIQQFLIKFDF